MQRLIGSNKFNSLLRLLGSIVFLYSSRLSQDHRVVKFFLQFRRLHRFQILTWFERTVSDKLKLFAPLKPEQLKFFASTIFFVSFL